MQLNQSITEPPALLNLSVAPYDLFWDLETVLLVLMIDFSKITFDGTIRKDDLHAYSRWAADRKGKAAARIAAEHFEKLENLAATLPRGYCAEEDEAAVACERDLVQKGEGRGLTMVDLLEVITFVSELPAGAQAEYFPGLEFPCC